MCEIGAGATLSTGALVHDGVTMAFGFDRPTLLVADASSDARRHHAAPATG